MGFVTLLFRLLAGHAMADFPLQNEFMAINKNRNAGPPKGYNPELHGPLQTVWPYMLTSHAFIHGLMVYLATGSVIFGLVEVAAHWTIDFFKCEKKYGIHTDQMLHIGFKVLYALILTLHA